MHCPRCGAGTLDDQKFCRYCGFSLAEVSLFLAEHFTAAELASFDRRRQIERWRRIVYHTTLVIGAIGLVALFIYELAIEDNPLDVVVIITILAILIGLILSFSLKLYAQSLGPRAADRAKENRISSGASPTAPITRQLPEDHFEPIPSITERTTNLLAEKKRNPT